MPFFKTKTFSSWLIVTMCIVLASLCIMIMNYFAPSGSIWGNNDYINTPSIGSNSSDTKDLTFNSLSSNHKFVEQPKTLAKANNIPASNVGNKDTYTATQRIIYQIGQIANARYSTSQEKSHAILEILNAHRENTEVVIEAVNMLAMAIDPDNLPTLLELLNTNQEEVKIAVIDSLANNMSALTMDAKTTETNKTKIEEIRNQLTNAYYADNASPEFRAAIEGRYNDFSPDPHEILGMSVEVIGHSTMNEGDLMFLQQSFFNPNAPYQTMFQQIATLPASEQIKIAQALSEQANLISEDEIKSLSPEHLSQIKRFLKNNSINFPLSI